MCDCKTCANYKTVEVRSCSNCKYWERAEALEPLHGASDASNFGLCGARRNFGDFDNSLGLSGSWIHNLYTWHEASCGKHKFPGGESNG